MRPTLLVSFALLAACGPSTPEPAAPAASAAPAATAEPVASASAAPAEPPAPARPVYDVDGPDGIRRMAGWEGARTGAVITTKKAWVVGPNLMEDKKLSFGSVNFRLVNVEKADANEVVFKDRDTRYAVPAALAWAATPAKGLKKGAAVRCSFGGNTVAGRVDAVDARSVTCALRFMGKTRKEKLPLDEVRPITGKVEPGATGFVIFEGDTARAFEGMVMAPAGDDAWVTVTTQFSGAGDPRANKAMHKVKAIGVEVIDPTKPFKVGDACQASALGGPGPCKVTKVIDGGLAYVLSFESGPSMKEEWELDTVGAAKAPRK